jgi:hypothetical protein
VVVVVVVGVVVSCLLAVGVVCWSCGLVEVDVCAWWCVVVVLRGGVECGVNVDWMVNVVGLDAGGGVVGVSIVVGKIWGSCVGVWGVWSIVVMSVVVVGGGGVVWRLLQSSKSPNPSGWWGDPTIFCSHLLTQCLVGW